MANATVFVNGVDTNGLYLYNTTGAALVADQFTVIGMKCLKATDAIADAAKGGFERLFHKPVRVNTFVTGDSTFATANLPVYWKPTTNEFAATTATGYYLVGYSIAPIASGVLEFIVEDPILK